MIKSPTAFYICFLNGCWGSEYLTATVKSFVPTYVWNAENVFHLWPSLDSVCLFKKSALTYYFPLVWIQSVLFFYSLHCFWFQNSPKYVFHLTVLNINCNCQLLVKSLFSIKQSPFQSFKKASDLLLSYIPDTNFLLNLFLYTHKLTTLS